jgi:hypothetical protein
MRKMVGITAVATVFLSMLSAVFGEELRIGQLIPHPEEACKAVSKGEGTSKAARHILRDAHFVGSSG